MIHEVGQSGQPTCTCTCSIHWNLLFGTPQFRDYKICSWKHVDRIFVHVTSIEGTPLFRGNGHFFKVPKPGFNLHSGETFP